MKLAVYNSVDPRAPADVQEFRRSALEAQMMYGEPVVLKSRYTERDVEEGRAIRCPYDHDATFEQGRQWDPYCFGTGYLGGFADGVITFVTIADAPVDKIRLDRSGGLYMQQEPQMIAPWTPTIGEGDLIITGRFHKDNWTVIELLDRYLIDEVTPSTLRGHSEYPDPDRYVTQQNCQITLLPHTHELYQVPIVFDYDAPPEPVTPGPGVDPTPSPEPPEEFNDTQDDEEDVDVFLPEEV